jgi:hypothetical protein
MFRTQIQLTEEQANALKRLAVKKGSSVSELIRQSVDILLQTSALIDPREQRMKAIEAAGKLHGGPRDLSINHDQYLAEAVKK